MSPTPRHPLRTLSAGVALRRADPCAPPLRVCQCSPPPAPGPTFQDHITNPSGPQTCLPYSGPQPGPRLPLLSIPPGPPALVYAATPSSFPGLTPLRAEARAAPLGTPRAPTLGDPLRPPAPRFRRRHPSHLPTSHPANRLEAPLSPLPSAPRRPRPPPRSWPARQRPGSPLV